MAFMIFIVGFVLGGLVGAGLVYSHEIGVLRGFRQRVEKVEQDYFALLKEQGGQEQHEEN